MMRVREAHAIYSEPRRRHIHRAENESNEQTHGTHMRHRDDSDLHCENRICVNNNGGRSRIHGGLEHHVPLSGGNSPPTLMKFRKEDAARLNVPSDSVVILDMSDRLETSRDMIGVCWSPRWGLYTRTNNGRGERKVEPLSHRESMTNGLVNFLQDLG